MLTRPFRAAIAAVAVALLFVPTPPPALRAQAAAGVDAALLAGLRWRSIGPARGGRSIAVAGSAAGRTSTTSARPAAASGRRPTAASPGARSPTASSRRRRSAPSPWPSRTPTSSTSGWAKSSCAATSSRATASTSRPTAARRGRTWASTRRMVDRAASASIPTNPDIVYVAALGDPVRPEPGARRLQVEGRRQDVGARAVPRRQDRRRRSRRWIRRTPTCSTPALWEVVPHAALAVERRPGQRALQDDRRRHDLDRAHEEPRAAGAALGQDRRRRSRAPTATASTRIIEADGRRRVPLRRRRRDLEAGQRRPPAAPARVLLHAHLRRPAGEGHGLRPQHRHLPLDRRRQDAARRSACRTATTTTCGSRRTIRSG